MSVPVETVMVPPVLSRAVSMYIWVPVKVPQRDVREVPEAEVKAILSPSHFPTEVAVVEG